VRNDSVWDLGDGEQEAYVGLDYGSLSDPTTQYVEGRRLAGTALDVRSSVKQLGYDIFIGKPISRPEYFLTASVAAGFSPSASF
jgi:hemolysin activation/secretion protein